MKRKPIEGEIVTRDCDLTIDQVQAINDGCYKVYVRDGRVAYDGIRYTDRGRVVLYYRYALMNSSDCERWLIRGCPITLVPTGQCA